MSVGTWTCTRELEAKHGAAVGHKPPTSSSTDTWSSAVEAWRLAFHDHLWRRQSENVGVPSSDTLQLHAPQSHSQLYFFAAVNAPVATVSSKDLRSSRAPSGVCPSQTRTSSTDGSGAPGGPVGLARSACFK
jgi:hypothetical protein